MNDGALFGLELQRARERRGLTLDRLADATKISASLFAGLERGDLSRWPGGIFRRAFVRSYAQAVGLDPDETVARFLRVHPDADGQVPAAPPPAPDAPMAEAEDSAPRLVLDEAAVFLLPRGGWRIARRLGAPVVDLLIAGIPALVVSLLFGWTWFLVVAAGVGLIGHVVSLALIGATPGAWLLLRRPVANVRPPDADAQANGRAEPEAAVPTPASAPASRRRQPRHASASSTRPASSRTRRVQH
jgi:transcriptional regulator with XRE-family HTH domain